MTSETRQLRHFAEAQLRVPTTLHDYQWEGISFLYRSQSALLADEMGLGKTVQASVALALLLGGQSEINRALIVAPTSLTMNWMDELAVWAPSVAARHVQGSESNRKAFYLLPVPVLVCSYEQIRSDSLDHIPSDSFDLVVLDEAQRIKNRNSATSLACRILPRRRAWALSATPLENDEDDIASILSFLDPSIKQYISKAHLSKKLESRMLRRRKSEVRAELPPVILQDIRLDLPALQREEYEKLWETRSRVVGTDASTSDTSAALLGLITRLKIICNFSREANISSKLDALNSIAEEAGPSARILVFSQFVETLRWISDRITLPFDFLIGGMPEGQRRTAMDRFRTGPTPRLLLVSLRAGGVGLNLGEATHVVVFDRWWNPAVEVQAIYRAHRFDRDEPLHVVRFLVANSIEERIATILDRKEGLFDEIVESVETTAHRFTKSELMQILEITPKDILSFPHKEQEDLNHGKNH